MYWYVIAAVLGFGFIIFIHELGHFVTAKLFKVKVNAFSLGFPPTVLHKQIGETDYRLGIIPVGGYVSMLGEDPTEETNDPRALSNIKPWKRAVIFLGGVGMNVISAMLIYMAASMIGIEVTEPVVGDVDKGTPAYASGLKPSDRLLSIDGRRVQSFEDITFYFAAGAFNNTDHVFTVEVERAGEATPLVIRTKAQAGGMQGLAGSGVLPALMPVVGEVDKDSPADQIGLKPGDRILSIDGEKMPFVYQVLREFRTWPDSSHMTMAVERDGKEVSLEFDPTAITIPSYGMGVPLQVDSVVEDGPAAKAGMKAGDYIVGVDGSWQPDFAQVQSTIMASEGKPVELVIWRDRAHQTLTVTPERNKDSGTWMIGFVRGGDINAPARLIEASGEGAAVKAGIPDGSTIVAIDGEPVRTWRRLAERLEALQGKPAEVTYVASEASEEKTATVTPTRRPPTGLAGMTIGKELRGELPAIYNPLAAFNIGLEKIRRVFVLQYISVAALTTRQVSPDQLMGPLRIGAAFYQTAERGASDYFMLLGLVSVAIAILNTMPIPPLDGGHVMFLVVEKLIRRPVPLRVRSVVTSVGTVLLLGLVAFAFFNDGRWAFQKLWY